MITTQTLAWDVAEFLDTPEMVAAYIEAALEEGTQAELLKALNDVARARGMSAMARETGLTREALYKALGEGGNPTLATLRQVLKAFGLRLSVTA